MKFSKSKRGFTRVLREVGWSFIEMGETLFISLVAVFIVRSFIAQPFLVSGSSMEPNFYDGNYLLVDEFTYRFREPNRGEIIVFKYPGNHRTYYIKRIIGLPGDTLMIDGGKIVIEKDGKREKLDESYIVTSWTGGHFETKLGGNEYFVMGDNRNFSFDSRSWGPLTSSDLVGLVRFRLWPVNQVMAFSAPTY